MPDIQKTLMEYRLQTAKEKLHSAEILLASGQYKDSVGRSYYAMFSAIRAILALDKVDFSKHAAIIAYFQKEYIKTEILPKEYSKFISTALQIRNNCDYADFFLVSKADAEEQCSKAVKFTAAIEDYLIKRTQKSNSIPNSAEEEGKP